MGHEVLENRLVLLVQLLIGLAADAAIRILQMPCHRIWHHKNLVSLLKQTISEQRLFAVRHSRQSSVVIVHASAVQKRAVQVLDFLSVLDVRPLDVRLGIDHVNLASGNNRIRVKRLGQHRPANCAHIVCDVLAQIFKHIGLGYRIIIYPPHPIKTHSVCNLVVVMLTLLAREEPLPLDALFLQDLKEVRIDQLCSHILWLVVVVEDDELIDALGLTDHRLQRQWQRTVVSTPCGY